jgi:hypothetical protein
MTTSTAEQAQVPSNPKETSASKAFTQLPPDIARAVAEYKKAQGESWNPDYTPGGADAKIRDLFAAYYIDDSPEEIPKDAPWKFEVFRNRVFVETVC